MHNFPVISLILANGITIALAVIENWDLATVMFIYLAQSIIIGFFTIVSMLTADTKTLAAEMEHPIREHSGTGMVTHRFAWIYQ